MTLTTFSIDFLKNGKSLRGQQLLQSLFERIRHESEKERERESERDVYIYIYIYIINTLYW